MAGEYITKLLISSANRKRKHGGEIWILYRCEITHLTRLDNTVKSRSDNHVPTLISCVCNTKSKYEPSNLNQKV